MSGVLDLGLRWPWVLPAAVVLVVVLLAWWSRRGRDRGRSGDPVLLAHLDRLRRLPRYAGLVRRRVLVGAWVTAAALVTLAGVALVVARPTQVEVLPPDERSRDVMLCLDASTSMDDDNAAVVGAVRDVLDGLDGDRVGLTLWSGAAVTVVPLTGDLDYVREQLDRAQQAFEGGDERYFAGVQLSGGSSLIGDGVVSCARRFDLPTEERSRVVLLSSDNEPRGKSVYDLTAAAAFATERDVVVHAIGAPELGEGSAEERDRLGTLSTAVEATGGVVAVAGQDGSVDQIVARIDALEQQRVEEDPEPVRRDDPVPGALLAAAGVVLLGVGWGAQDVVRRPRRRGGAS
ncbi:MAG: hypothetical protein CMH83_12290 [Nocardioides sp.]|nr:hypothetical protein [Nocardioides sp.]